MDPTRETLRLFASQGDKKQLEYWATQLEEIKRRKLTLFKGVPSGVSQAFSLALNYCHLAELEAKTDRDL